MRILALAPLLYFGLDLLENAAALAMLVEYPGRLDGVASIIGYLTRGKRACELVWVLRGVYRKEKAVIVTALQKIAGTALFSFNDRNVLRQAIVDYRGGSGDFADYLIGHQNRRAGCERTVTFDRTLSPDYS